MVMAAFPDHISVYPSGAALATRSTPIAPELPAMFSTITGWPQASENFCANIRAVTSVELPAVKPTTILTGLSGQLVWAMAGCTTASASRHARAPRIVDSIVKSSGIAVFAA